MVEQQADAPPFVSIHGLHHWAYRCRDAEQTRRFDPIALRVGSMAEAAEAKLRR